MEQERVGKFQSYTVDTRKKQKISIFLKTCDFVHQIQKNFLYPLSGMEAGEKTVDSVSTFLR